MGSAQQSQPASRGRNLIGQSERVRRLIIYGAVLLGVFLLGLVPMWMRAREHARERNSLQAALRVSTLQNTLANAALDAHRGEYEPARQAASDFFTNVRVEIEQGRNSVFNETQQNALRSLLAKRDDTITLLARNDPASVNLLVDFYNQYRQTIGGTPAR